MKRSIALILCAGLLAAACGGAGLPGLGGPSISVGLVTDVGGLDDKSFNTLANKGLEDAKKDLGVTGRVIESKEQANYVPNLTQFAQQNTGLTVAVGFLMQNAIWKVGKQFPNAKFMIVDGAPQNDQEKTEDLPNVANIFFAEQEAGYLVGVITGEMMKAKIGKASGTTACAMGGIPIPPVDKWIAGYQEALERYGVKMLLGYSQSFTDQQKAKEIGLQHISQGCTVLFQVAGGSGLGYIQAAKEKNVYAIGVDADQAYVAPETILTSALKRVDRSVYETIKAVKDGKFKAGANVFNAANDGVGFGAMHKDVPDSVKKAADQALKDIKDGKIKPRTEIKK